MSNFFKVPSFFPKIRSLQPTTTLPQKPQTNVPSTWFFFCFISAHLAHPQSIPLVSRVSCDVTGCPMT
uniref:Ovule protein n=1 Tax=Caenorhabditis tropicalis TaxID=1561998 RepID=A0A1I7V2V5_9PELO